MPGKVLEFSTPGTRLSVRHRQLVIERPELAPVTRPIEDIGVLIVDDVRASFTQAVFVALMEVGATVIVTGPDHLPVGVMTPLDGHHALTERHHAQVRAPLPLKKRLWQGLVQAKIRQQARVLEHFTGTDAGLHAMVGQVRSADASNREAFAAQVYWPRLFGPDFRRDRAAEGINAALNYGYAVIRAALARALVGSGLLPSLGVFHHRRSNPFCLADDLLEPFRAYVDWRVRILADEADGQPLTLADRATRAALLSLFNETVEAGGRRLPLLLALRESSASLARALTDHPEARSVSLVLPSSLPLVPDSGEQGEEP